MIVIRARRSGARVPTDLKRLVASALAGRLHSTASNVVLGMAVQRWTGSFASAGAVIGALVLGQGLSSPLRGRAADRWAVPTLVICGLSYMTGLTALACLTQIPAAHVAVAIAVAFLSGIMLPPVAPVLRSAIPTLARDEVETDRTLAWEATYQELIFIGGPPIALGVAAAMNPSASLALLGISAGAGAAAFAVALRRQHAKRAAMATLTVSAGPRPERRSGHAPEPPRRGRRPQWPAIARLAVAYGFLLGSLTAMTLLAVTVAVAIGRPVIAGALEAMLAVGSMAGGALASRGLLDRLTFSGRMACMALALSGLTAVCALTSSVLAVGCALMAAGFWVAPSLAVQGVVVLQVSDPARRAEMFGWVNAVGLGINAGMTPLTGWALDLRGTAAAAALATISIALGGVLVAGLTRERTSVSELSVG